MDEGWIPSRVMDGTYTTYARMRSVHIRSMYCLLAVHRAGAMQRMLWCIAHIAEGLISI